MAINITSAPYNCVGDNATDNTAGINAALLTGKPLYAPAGIYRTKGGHNFSQSGQNLRGDGPGATIFRIDSTSGTNTFGFSMGAFLTNVGITDVTVDRLGTAVSGSDGIRFSQSTSKSYLKNVILTQHFNGLLLGPTDNSIIRDSVIHHNVQHGILHTNTNTPGSAGNLQWTLDHVLLEVNGASGYAFVTTTGGSAPSRVSLGEFINVSTYANGGNGMLFIDNAAVTANSVRLHQCFFGDSGQSEVYMDLHSGNHQITDCYIELPQSGIGLFLSENIVDVLISGSKFVQTALEGIYSQAAILNIVGSTFTNCGLTHTSGRRNGIQIASGVANVTACTFMNVPGTSDMQYGIYHPGGTLTQTANLFSNVATGIFP